MTAPIDLNLVRAFRAVHERGSFSAAAEDLGVPRSTVSRAIAALEEALDVQLFRRTTRKVSTTAEGNALFARLAPSLAGLESALAEVPAQSSLPSGTLRVTATGDFATTILTEVVTRYCALHPAVTVDMHLTGRVVDIAREGFDLALRIHTTRPPQSSLIARKVGTVAFRLYASPAYVARWGAPQRIEELSGHDWISFRGEKALRLRSSQDHVAADVRTRVFTDEMYFARELVRSGAGIGALPSYIAEADVAAGLLRRVIPRWVSPTGAVYLVTPDRKHPPARVTAFRDLLLEALRQRPLVAERVA